MLPRVSFIKKNPLGFPPSGRPKLLSNGFGIEVGDDQRALLRKARLLRDRCGKSDVPVIIQTSTGEPIEI